MPSFRAIKGGTPFVRRLRLIMSENCLKQWEFERKCHLPQGRLSAIFSGRQTCLPEHVDYIAEGLRTLHVDPRPFYGLAKEHNALMRRKYEQSTVNSSQNAVALFERIRKLDMDLLAIKKEYDDICQCLRSVQKTMQSVAPKGRELHHRIGNVDQRART